ncbi:hypothetical protein GCM10025880_06800 [Methylorubrum aminovorans]|uniref:hypothetical protein n=1 Tax=Methylorubrum aminovorans TaxID=269069 RepID=UPI0023EA36A6|nr:hypothetical protein [Methylorubrum aminovorans]GMA74263.1 hypothetical protein GCM10025880_06800 [Methylorubrum aminovorans]
MRRDPHDFVTGNLFLLPKGEPIVPRSRRKSPQGQSERAVDLQALRDRATIADVIGANADHPFPPPDLTIDQSAPREACHGRDAGGGSAISVGAFAADPQVQPIQQHSNSVFNIRSLYNQRDTG